VESAANHHADLIMMPTHGVGPFRSFLVGSATAKVLHDATCPVWTAAHAEQQTVSGIPKAILCAIDGSPATPSLARWAVEFAKTVGARLTLLHVTATIHASRRRTG
jgi:nucleotide-binding universal stress UspA family protein